MQGNDLALLDGVAEASGLANATSPQTVSQREFDDARARCLLNPGIPRAKRITERLGLPWRDVLRLAHAPADEQQRLLGANARPPNAKWVRPGNAVAAVAVVAKRLNADSLTQDEYRRERAKMVAHDAKRWMHGRQLRMPSEAQVTKALGSWDAALRAAGLQTTHGEAGRRGKAWTRDTCIAAVARYLATAGHSANAAKYRDWAATQKQAPSGGTIRRFGGWPVVRQAALDRLLEEELRGREPFGGVT